MTRFFIAWFILGALGLIAWVVTVEISEGRETDRRRRRHDAEDLAEFDAWLRARDVTGRVSR